LLFPFPLFSDELAVYPTPSTFSFLLDIWGAAAALMIQRPNYSVSSEEVHTLESTCFDYDEQEKHSVAQLFEIHSITFPMSSSYQLLSTSVDILCGHDDHDDGWLVILGCCWNM
jgi:hypothetical protein